MRRLAGMCFSAAATIAFSRPFIGQVSLTGRGDDGRIGNMLYAHFHHELNLPVGHILPPGHNVHGWLDPCRGFLREKH